MRRFTSLVPVLAVIGLACGATEAATLTVTNDLALWLKADSLSLNNGDPVTLWTDSSGNGNDATGTAGVTPTYVASDPAIQNMPALQFDSLNDRMNAGSDVDATQLTIFSVFRATDLQFGAIVDMVNPSPLSENYALLTGSDGAGQEIWHLQWYNSGFRNENTGNGNPDYANTWTIRTDRHDGSDGEIYQNGNLLLTTTGGTGGLPSLTTDPDNQLWIGHYQVGSGGYFGGQIAEILIYDRALSESERVSVEAYLTEKYVTGPIPEPSTALLLAAGAGVVAARRRRA